MRPRHARFDLALLAVLALLTNFAYLHYSNGDLEEPDSPTYLAPARNMLHGLGFVTAPDDPEVFRTPGYPIFLLPFVAATSSLLPIVVVQHLFVCALALAVYLAARRMAGSRRGALLAGILVALDVSTIHYSNKVLSEALFTIVLFALFMLVLRMDRRGATLPVVLSAGAIAGALVIIRPVAIVYFVLIAVFLLRSLSIKTVAAFTAIAIAFPIGWGVRNLVETDTFTVSTVAGNNMLIHRGAPSIAILEKGDFDEQAAIWRDRVTAIANREIEAAEETPVKDIPGPLMSSYYGRIGRRIALEHPWGLTLVLARGLLVNLFDSDFEALTIVSTIPSTVIELSVNILTTAATLLALLGLVALWRRDRAVAAFIGATILYFVFVSAGSEAESRFRVPVVPMMAIAAGAAADAIGRGLARYETEN